MAGEARRISADTGKGEWREVLRCALVLLGVLAFGTLGFYCIEGPLANVENPWTLWQCLYFTLITVTTVGYEDIGTTEVGKVFTSFLLLVGIGTFTYTLSELVRVAITLQPAWMRKMNKQIQSLENHIIICGFGQLGKSIAERLTSSQVEFVIIDNDPKIWETAIEMGYNVIQGSSTEDDVLIEAGIERAKGIVCGVSSDAANVFTVLTARELNQKLMISCVADFEASIPKFERAGATLVVSPNFSAGFNIATAILRPHLTEAFNSHSHGRGEIEMGEVKIDDHSILNGKTVIQIGREINSVVFVAMKREGEDLVIRPGGNQQFQSGDILIVAGKIDDLSKMYELAHTSKAAA